MKAQQGAFVPILSRRSATARRRRLAPRQPPGGLDVWAILDRELLGRSSALEFRGKGCATAHEATSFVDLDLPVQLR